MEKIALFPGSFDPIHNGHIDIVDRSRHLFDKLIIAIGNNSGKNYLFDIDQREAWITQAVAQFPNVVVMTYRGMTINFCIKAQAKYIVRGLRTSADFEFEKAIAQMNRAMNPAIETLFIIASPAFTPLSSSIIRDIIRNKGNANAFLPFKMEINY